MYGTGACLRYQPQGFAILIHMKLPGVTPDIEQALSHFLSLTALHNAYPLVLAGVMAITLAAALHKPKRSYLLIFLGTALLLFHFEYLKHILGPLEQQTLITLTTETPRYRFVWFVQKSLTRGLPLLLLLAGWGSSILGLVLLVKTKKSFNKLC